MGNTNDKFAQEAGEIFNTLYTSLLSAFEMYLKNFKEKNDEIDNSFGRLDTVIRYKKQIKEQEGDEKNKENVEALKYMARIKENESLLKPGDKPHKIILKQKILSEQIVVYCSTVFESFRVRLIVLLFKNNSASRKAYIKLFNEAAAKWFKNTGDMSFTQVMEEDMILPKNLKLIQNSGKLRDAERLMYGLNLDNDLIKDIYQKNNAMSVVFREVRNLVVHRKQGDELVADSVFYSSIKHGVGHSYAQKKEFKLSFERYLSFSWEKKSAEILLSPYNVFDSIIGLLNLSYLYCFSVSNNNNFYFEESLFNDVCVDYHENKSKDVYIGFFVKENIRPLFNFQKNKDDFKDTVKLVNYSLSCNILKEHFAGDSKLKELLEKSIKNYCDQIKKINEDGLIYNIVTSYLNKDVVSLTKAADNYLKQEDEEKKSLFEWFIFRSLKDNPFINKYLNSPIN